MVVFAVTGGRRWHLKRYVFYPFSTIPGHTLEGYIQGGPYIMSVGNELYLRNGDSCAKTNCGNMLEQFLGNFWQILIILFKSSFFIHELFTRSLMN